MKLRNKKTGEVIDLDIANIKAQYGGISVIPEPVKLGGDEYVYYSLEGLVHEWEDYKPKEPLIKDEKIRKAVRAWAEVNRDVGQVMFSKDVTGKSYSYLSDTDSDAQIKFNFVIDGELDVYEIYSIEELCGEEEE